MEAEGKRGATAASSERARAGALAFRGVLAHAFGEGASVELDDEGGIEGASISIPLVAPGGDALVFGFDKPGAAALLTALFRSGALERTRPHGVERVEAALAALLSRAAFDVLGLELSSHAAPRSVGYDRTSFVVLRGRERFVVTLAQSLSEATFVARVTLRLPLIVAVSAAPRAELEPLSVGDLWLPESGWLSAPEGLLGPATLNGAGFERALLGLPGGERALWLALSVGGPVVSGPAVRLDALCQTTADEELDASWARVQVELGDVELTLPEVSSLELGQILRLVPSEVARLVVDGEMWAKGRLERTPDGVGLLVHALGGPG